MSNIDHTEGNGYVPAIIGVAGTLIATGLGLLIAGLRWLIGLGHDVSVLQAARIESDKREAERAVAIDLKFEHMSSEMRAAVAELRGLSQGTHESVIRLETKMDLLIQKP